MGHGRKRPVVQHPGWRCPAIISAGCWQQVPPSPRLALPVFSGKSPPLTWGILAAGSAVLYLIGRMGQGGWPAFRYVWALIGAVGSRLSCWRLSGFVAEQITSANDNLTAGIFAVGGAGLLLFAEDRMLDGVWLTIGMAVLAAAYAFSTRTLAVKLLGPIAAALGSLTALRLFVSRELWNDDRTLATGSALAALWLRHSHRPVLLRRPLAEIIRPRKVCHEP